MSTNLRRSIIIVSFVALICTSMLLPGARGGLAFDYGLNRLIYEYDQYKKSAVGFDEQMD